MSNTDSICIYVFSGPHVGAEVILLNGSYTIGTDDNCDIIFKDTFLAPNHAQLNVHINGVDNNNSLTVIPLEGEVWVNNEQISKDGYNPQSGEFWYLGGSCLAWNIPGTNWQNKAAQLYAERLTLEEDKIKNASTDESLSLEKGEKPVDEMDVSVVDKALGHVLPPDVIINLKKFPVGKIFGVIFLIFFLGAIAISYYDDGQKGIVEIKILQKLLKDNGFDNISVIQGTQQIIVRGFVQSDIQRQVVYSLAQGMHVPVYIDVGVRDDVIKAIKTAFISRGIYISVEGFEDPGDFSISGYMKDSFVEEWAISAMRDDVPIPFKLKKHIVYAKEVMQVLQDIFSKRNLQKLRVNYLAGNIEITGVFDEELKSNLDQALEEIKDSLGVYIVFKVNQMKPEPLITKNTQEDTTDTTTTNDDNSVLGSLVVTGVTVQPIPFITLNTGERVFRGGALPTGFILDSISSERLIFYKDNQYVEYPLRGAK